MNHSNKALLFAFGILATSVASAAAGTWSSASRPSASHRVHAAVKAASPIHPAGGVTFYTDQAAFDAAVGDPTALAAETFDGGTPVSAPTSCTEPLGSTSNDDCFTPGQLAEGFEITSSSGAGVILLPANFVGAGQTTQVVGANTFTDSTAVAFAPTVSATSADVYSGLDVGTVDIEVFDDGGVSLGTTTVTPSDVGESAFFGVISTTTPIGQITLATENDGGELIDNLRFGAAAAPSTSPSVAKAFSPASVPTITDSVITLTLSNPGTIDATLTADLVDTLPAGLVATAASALTTCVGGTGATTDGATLTLGTGAVIPAGGNCMVTATVQATAEGDYVNTILAGGLVTDQGSSEADASATLTVAGIGDDGIFCSGFEDGEDGSCSGAPAP